MTYFPKTPPAIGKKTGPPPPGTSQVAPGWAYGGASHSPGIGASGAPGLPPFPQDVPAPDSISPPCFLFITRGPSKPLFPPFDMGENGSALKGETRVPLGGAIKKTLPGGPGPKTFFGVLKKRVLNQFLKNPNFLKCRCLNIPSLGF